MEDLLQLDSVLRFASLYAITVLAPGILLAYFGMSSIKSEESAVWTEVRTEAGRTADTWFGRTEQIFNAFEERTIARLDAGRSPLESALDLSPNLLVALRLDTDGMIAAPFAESSFNLPADQTFFYTGTFADGRKAERSGHLGEAIKLFERASREATGHAHRGVAALEYARLLAKSGESRAAESAYASVISDYPEARNGAGFLLRDLATLKRAELLLLREPVIGVGALKDLVDVLLARRWELSRGGEISMARRAISRMEPHADADWLASTRSRLDSRSSQMYWTERLIPELKQIIGSGTALKVEPRTFHYTQGDDVLWASIWWGADRYIFALSWKGLLETVRELGKDSLRPGGQVEVSLVPPDVEPPAGVLAQRNLVPWMAGWTPSVYPADAAALQESQASRRARRLGIVGAAMLLIVVGAILSARLVGRELELARMKTQFAANVSHELRSPITQIRLKAESLQLGLARDEERRQQHYDGIVRESERLSRLVDNVLDFSAIERGTKQYSFVPTDMAEVVRQCVDSMRFSTVARGLQIDIEIDEDLPIILASPEAIGQAMTNLLSNAAKYGATGERVIVSVKMVELRVVVSVIDSGLGIANDEIPHIFDQYYRSKDPNARRLKGTGIGLAIVKYIMEAHGGRVEVISELGEGTTFSLHFPLSPPDRTGAH